MSRGDGLARLRRALEEHGCRVQGNSAQCPAHDDRQASLSIGQGRDAAILKCHVNPPCPADAILEALGLSAADLHDEPRAQDNGHGFQVTATYPYTDEAGVPLFYAERRLPKGFRQYHIENGRKVWDLKGVRRVLYRLPRVLAAVEAGETVYICEGEKDVHALEAAGVTATCNPMGAGKWRPEFGDALTGAQVVIVADADEAGRKHAAAVRADLDGKAGSVTVVEPAGGKDAADHLAAGHGLGDFVPLPPPPGPAAALARIKKAAESEDDEDLVPVAVATEIAAMAREGMDDETMLAVRVYLAREKRHLGAGPRDLERIVKAEAAAAFREAMQEQMRRSRDNTVASHPPAEPAHLHTPPPLASDQDILRRMVVHLRVCRGLVGENRAAKLLYLAFTSRLLAEPVSAVVKGLSSSGKSYTIECVAALFPPDAVYTMTAMSERALVYLDEPLAHRTLILYEAAALREGREKTEDNQTAYIVRSLLSEDRIEYPVVIRGDDGQFRTETKVIPGPTNLVTSTTSISLHGENETRMLSVPSNDSKAQTRAVMLESSGERKRAGADFTGWHDLQRWLAGQETAEVVIPYAACVAAQIPPVAVRLRRDWNAVRSLIRAHALLHQVNRKRDEHGRIMAGLYDYTAVRSLVNDLIADAVGATVPASVKETVELVAALTADPPADPDGVKVAKVASLLKLERSAATRRLHSARDRGYLVNIEDKRGKPARYVLGDPLPVEVVVLPPAKDVCTPPCTHLGQGETAGQECDCTGVCRCADDAGGETWPGA